MQFTFNAYNFAHSLFFLLIVLMKRKSCTDVYRTVSNRQNKSKDCSFEYVIRQCKKIYIITNQSWFAVHFSFAKYLWVYMTWLICFIQKVCSQVDCIVIWVGIAAVLHSLDDQVRWSSGLQRQDNILKNSQELQDFDCSLFQSSA